MIDDNIYSKPTLTCRGEFRDLRFTIDDNIYSKPTLTCRGGFRDLRFMIDDSICSKPALILIFLTMNNEQF